MSLRHPMLVSTAICTLLPDAALSQTLGGGSDAQISIGRILAALLVCLSIACAAALLLRRRGTPQGWRGMVRIVGLAGPGRIAVLESRRIGTQAEVCLLRCDGVDYLILCSPTQSRVLSRQHVGPA